MDEFNQAVERLRSVFARVNCTDKFKNKVQARDEVLARYRPIFAPANLTNLTEEEFRSFLRFRNNRHWTGLQRNEGLLTESMEAVRQALAVLLDEQQPLAQRFDDALSRIRGFGTALATAILLVVYPDRYGLWNEKSKDALKNLGVWPKFKRGMSDGQKYEWLNDLLHRLAKTLNVDLWTLDWLLWELEQQQKGRGS